jgi:4,5-dihydroxyphthalate decarboxylase
MSAPEIELGFPIMRYDITLPLLEGRVEVPGVRLVPTRTTSMVFRDEPRLREGDFGLADLNLGYLLPAIEAGWELVALPLFVKRKPAYQFIFCRADAGIQSPRDLEGKRIGSGSYRTALTVWARGLLREHHGADLTKAQWVVWREEVFPVHDPAAQIELIADRDKSVAAALLDGDVDALVTDISDAALFATLENDPRVRRLFPDYAAEDGRLYRATGIYTPVHGIVISRALDRREPDLARRLYAAFEQAKALAYEDILSDRAGFSVVYLRERLLEQRARWGDPFAYGLAANRATMDTFARYNVEQGMIRAPLPDEQVFARSTLDT